MNKNTPICNFCSKGLAVTKCIHCNHFSCGENIYCCQIFQKNKNELSIVCNLCVIEIGNKLKPLDTGKRKKRKKKSLSKTLSNINKKIVIEEKRLGYKCKKIDLLKNNLNLVNESSKLLKIF